MSEFLAPLMGQRIPGGCDDCDAYQEVKQIPPGFYMLCVCHDDDCQFLAQYEENSR